MGAQAATRRQAVGEAFSLDKMVRARDLTFQAVRRIAAEIRPGITEGRGNDIAQDVLEGMGMDRLWHKNVVRFGPGTLKTFFDDFAPDYVLKPDDIFFIDLGAVWDGHEGDAGDTFVVGEDADMAACAKAARTLWHDVAARWRAGGVSRSPMGSEHRASASATARPSQCEESQASGGERRRLRRASVGSDRSASVSSGQVLYEYARDRAAAMGWRLNWAVKGHRVSDFPHAIYKDGKLGDFDGRPAAGLWILEIQIAHPTKAFGAFYEDLLVEGEAC